MSVIAVAAWSPRDQRRDRYRRYKPREAAPLTAMERQRLGRWRGDINAAILAGYVTKGVALYLQELLALPSTRRGAGAQPSDDYMANRLNCSPRSIWSYRQQAAAAGLITFEASPGHACIVHPMMRTGTPIFASRGAPIFASRNVTPLSEEMPAKPAQTCRTPRQIVADPPRQIVADESSCNESSRKKERAPAALSFDFDRFIAGFPERTGMDKTSARKAAQIVFDKLVRNGADPEQIIKDASRYDDEQRNKDRTYTMLPANWLKAWKPPPPPLPTVQPGTAEWQELRAHYVAHGVRGHVMLMDDAAEQRRAFPKLPIPVPKKIAA
jgi:hypothetical protein